MLVLSRNLGQKILIGTDIEVIYLGFNQGGQIKLGISAPKGVKILREELKRHEDIPNSPGNSE